MVARFPVCEYLGNMVNSTGHKLLIPELFHGFRRPDRPQVVGISQELFWPPRAARKAHLRPFRTVTQDTVAPLAKAQNKHNACAPETTMSDGDSSKVLVRRPSKVMTDDRGRSVWADPVESANLELVSTQMLKVMLSSRDDSDRKAIEEAADNATEGVLARNPSSGSFEIISEEELEKILEVNDDLPKISRPADATIQPLHDYVDDEQLSLVSTQALRRVLSSDDEKEEAALEALEDDGGGFNPYDNG